MINEQLIFDAFTQSIEVKKAARDSLRAPLARAAAAMLQAFRSGRQVIFMGNGGSAADAQHLAAEFVGRYRRERRALPALALHANSSSLTAIGNDYGYEHSFLRPLQAFSQPGDVVVGISTSGNSRNILLALAWARAQGLPTIGMTGAGGGAMGDKVDVLLNVPSCETPRIQECHILMGHILCEIVESELFSE